MLLLRRNLLAELMLACLINLATGTSEHQDVQEGSIEDPSTLGSEQRTQPVPKYIVERLESFTRTMDVTNSATVLSSALLERRHLAENTETNFTDEGSDESTNGNFMHGLDYAGFDVTGLTAQATLDACYETCKLFSDVPGQICNTYFAEYCGKGSCRFFNVDNGSAVAWQCEIRFQPDFNSEEDTPVAYDHYIDYDDYSLPFGYNESFGSGEYFNASKLEEMEAAGGYSYYTNYSAGVVNTTTSETYLECYQKCKDFNERPGQFCNVYSFCGDYEDCGKATKFSTYLLQVQHNLAYGSQVPKTIFPGSGNRNAVGSGIYLNSSKLESFKAAGNFTWGVEYVGSPQSQTLVDSPMECFEQCKAHGACNVFIYCGSTQGCTTTINPVPVSFGECLLRSQGNLTSWTDAPQQIQNNEFAFGSGIYIAPPPPPPSHIGAIVGGVLGGVAAVVGLSIIACILKRRLNYYFNESKQQPGDGEYEGFKQEYLTGDLVEVSELPTTSPVQLNLALNCTSGSLESTGLLMANTRRDNFTHVEAEEVDEFLMPSQEGRGSLEDSWRIDPQQLKCRRTADGELVKLGQGGGGAVYLGVLHMTTDVAIKIISSPSPAQQRSFVREIMILKGCRHPNIIFFLGASVLSDRTLLVMEAMPGGDLCSQLRRDEKGRFRWGKRGQRVALDVAKGLAFFHTHNVLHLDMKSPNILLGQGVAKIADVGLGRKVQEGETISNAYGASVPWCGPEQLLGYPCTPATDVFALGVIMWELCTGEPPTERRNYRPVEHPDEAPREVADMIRMCMMFDAQARPTAQEVHDIIQASSSLSQQLPV